MVDLYPINYQVMHIDFTVDTVYGGLDIAEIDKGEEKFTITNGKFNEALDKKDNFE